MTKEEVLEKSRNENKSQDIVDLEIQKKAAKTGIYSGVFLCVIINILSIFVFKRVCYEVFMMFAGMESVLFFVKYFNLRKKHELLVAIMYAIGFVLITAGWVLSSLV